MRSGFVARTSIPSGLVVSRGLGGGGAATALPSPLVNSDFSIPGRWPGEAYGWTMAQLTSEWELAGFFRADETWKGIEEFWWERWASVFSQVGYTVCLFDGALQNRIEHFTNWLESSFILWWTDELAQGVVATEVFTVAGYVWDYADATWESAGFPSATVEDFPGPVGFATTWNPAWNTAAVFDGISREEFTSETGWTQQEKGLE